MDKPDDSSSAPATDKPDWLSEVEKHAPLARLVAAMVETPDQAPPAELLEEVTRKARHGELARRIPPNTMGVHLLNLGELILLRRRMEFQRAIKAEDREVDELQKRRLSINLRLALFADTLLDWLASLVATIPGTLAFILKRAPIRTRKFRYPWMVISLVVIGGVWFLPGPWWVAAPFALLFCILLFFLLLAGQFSNADKFEDKLEEIIASLTEKKGALLKQRSVVSDSMKSFLESPEEHLEDRVDQLQIEEVNERVEEDRAALDRARSEFAGDKAALAYLDALSSITHALAVKRSEARFSCEREEIAIERRMAAKRWSSTVMAMSLSKGTTLLRMFILIFTLLVIPVVIAMTKTGPDEAPAEPATEAMEGAPSEGTAPDELDAVQTGVKKVDLKTISRYGLMIVVSGIVSLFLAWTITFLLRIVPRHIQMMKAAKRAMIDGLINEYEWHKVQLRLFESLLAGMEQASKILGVELETSHCHMVTRDRLESERDMRLISRRLDRLTKKAWSSKTKGSDHKGGLMDSGAPEDLADATIADLLL